MMYSRDVEITVAGAQMELGVDFVYSPGEPESCDCPSVPESVEVLDLYFLSPTGDEDTKFSTGQFSAVMAAAGKAIEDALLEGMRQELEVAGFYRQNGQWVMSESLKSYRAAFESNLSSSMVAA
jgi:hypothetical protein